MPQPSVTCCHHLPPSPPAQVEPQEAQMARRLILRSWHMHQCGDGLAAGPLANARSVSIAGRAARRGAGTSAGRAGWLAAGIHYQQVGCCGQRHRFRLYGRSSASQPRLPMQKRMQAGMRSGSDECVAFRPSSASCHAPHTNRGGSAASTACKLKPHDRAGTKKPHIPAWPARPAQLCSRQTCATH